VLEVEEKTNLYNFGERGHDKLIRGMREPTIEASDDGRRIEHHAVVIGAEKVSVAPDSRLEISERGDLPGLAEPWTEEAIVGHRRLMRHDGLAGERFSLGRGDHKWAVYHQLHQKNISAARVHELGGRYARTSGTEVPPFFTEGGVESIAAKHVAIMRHRWRGCQEESRCHRIRPAEHLPKLFRTIIRHALIGDVVERPITERVGALRPDEPEPEPIDAEMIS